MGMRFWMINKATEVLRTLSSLYMWHVPPPVVLLCGFKENMLQQDTFLQNRLASERNPRPAFGLKR